MERRRTVVAGIVAACAMLCSVSGAGAAYVTRLAADDPKSPIAPMVAVPIGAVPLNLINDTSAGPSDLSIPKESPQRMGDAPTQTRALLERLQQMLARVGLNIGDVVQARILLASD